MVRFILFYAPCLLVQLLGGMVTRASVTTWYPTLTKSVLTPPGYVFGIAWSILYLLMALAAARIYTIRGAWRSRSLVWWGIQLVLGFLWSLAFFGQRDIYLGLGLILVTFAVVVVVSIRFWRIDRRAGWLMVPLCLWLSFATYLNAFIVLHNPVG